jgi:hypothetical protein
LLLVLELSNSASEFPELNFVAVHQLFGLFFGRVIVCAQQVNAPHDVAIPPMM